MTSEQRAALLLSNRNLRYYYQISFSLASEAFNKGEIEQWQLIQHLGSLKETERQIKELKG